MFDQFTFANPQFFWLLLLLPLAIVWYVYNRNNQNAALKISSLEGFKASPSFWVKFKPFLFVLRLFALALLITALARPQHTQTSTKTKTNKGIDIVMAIDVSSSMLARDLKPNRLGALKQVAEKFVDDRPNDRIGLVVYAAESYTKSPITSDKRVISNALREIEFNPVIQDGTAIGMGLATAVNRLKESKAKSKVIILLTDGVNNTGFIQPQTATELAEQFGIKTYTIGLGTKGNAMGPIVMKRNGTVARYGLIKVEIDEDLLKEIAKKTGGKYFRATNNKKLEEIYTEINKLEKTEVEEFKYTNYEEKYRPLVLLAGMLLFFELLLRVTVYRSFV